MDTDERVLTLDTLREAGDGQRRGVRAQQRVLVDDVLGQALDAGIENGLNARIWGIGALLLVLFVVYAVGDTMLSYFGVTAWMRTAFDVDRLVASMYHLSWRMQSGR